MVKTRAFGTPLLIAVGTFMLLWLVMGGTNSGGLNDGVQYKGFVTWEHRAGDGAILESFSSHNALNVDAGLDDTVNRLIGGMTTDITLTDGTTAGTGAEAFARIFLSEQQRNSVSVAYDSTDVAEDVGSETGGTDVVGSNPSQGVVTASSSGGGSGTIAETFEAEAAATILQLALVSTASTLASGDAQPTDAEILATQDVNITLADEDTLAITWTVTATGS